MKPISIQCNYAEHLLSFFYFGNVHLGAIVSLQNRKMIPDKFKHSLADE